MKDETSQHEGHSAGPNRTPKNITTCHYEESAQPTVATSPTEGPGSSTLMDLTNPTIINHPTSRGSIVGIATGYRLDDRGVKVRVLVRSLLHIMQTDSGDHPTSYPLGDKAVGA
jgi:hypothetical protein